MILPTKRISEERALIGIGGDVLSLLEEPKTVSRLWDEFQQTRKMSAASSQVTYDWFVLALDLLYMLSAVSIHMGLVRRIEA